MCKSTALIFKGVIMSSKNFHPTSKKSLCPVCDDSSGKCRSTDTELVLCMNTLDATRISTGWKFLGVTKGGGQWGRIVPAGQPESGNDKTKRLERAAERAAVEAARIARLKPKEVRDSEYRHLVANCPILEADRADLTKRGLTDEDLAKLTPINDGKGGYIVPIRDRDGLMVGGQRRLSNAASGGKYRWATTGENQLPPTNELPLAHWKHSPHIQSIVLMDGTGVKPYLAARRLNALAIGASGGSYTSSSKTLKATLDRFSDLPIRFTPDAGDVENALVMRRLLATYRLIKSFGREMGIEWWGQTSKGIHQDVDEISLQVETRTISWGEFLEIANYCPTEEEEDRAMSKEPCESRHFETSPNEGLVLVTREADGNGGFRPARHNIGNHLQAIAYVNNPNGDGSSIFVQFKSLRNTMTRWVMPRGYLVNETSTMLAELTNRGYFFNLSQKKHLLEYLNGLGQDIETAYTITDSTGWVNGSFVSQAKTYGDVNLRFRDVEGAKDVTCEVTGTWQCWTDRVAKFCGGNSRLIFMLGIAYAAPLLEPLELESGGFHFYHSTSAGKTTLLMVAASVVGIKKIPQWNTTANGLEATATAHNNMLLPLDEIGEANEREVGKSAYMLANGQGKTRMTKQLTNRKAKTWKLLFASTGEVGMAEYIKQAGVQVKGGQEVRMPDIPAVPKDSPYGVFENIHGANDSKEFAQALELACAENHGTAIDAYLSRLVVDLTSEDTKKALRKRVLLIADKLTGSIQNFAIRRVANRFALVQVALGLAHSYDLLPFPVEDIDWAVSTLFQDWLTARGGDGSIEIKNACDQIGHLLSTQENGERFFTLPENDGRQTRNQIGYRKLSVVSTGGDGTTYGGTEELWVFPEVFRKELCEGGNPTEIAKELVTRGWLTTGQFGNLTQTQKIKGRVQRFYCFRKWSFLGVTTVTGVTSSPDTVPEVTPRETSGVTGVTSPPLVTPVTPEQEASVTSGSLSQHQVTPVTAVTPLKTSFPNLGTNPQVVDVEEI
jgi:uncharacterized protein (DUF927 family)